MRLIDADALRADYFVTSTTTNNPLYRYVSMEQIANAPTVEPASPWHRVEDELPKFGEYVLAWEIQGFAVVDKYVGIGDGRWDLENDGAIYTHWMPLPEPPKEDA